MAFQPSPGLAEGETTEIDLHNSMAHSTPYRTRRSNTINRSSQAYVVIVPEDAVLESPEFDLLSEKLPLTPAGGIPIHLGLYFLVSLGLTLYNKAVLGSFPYPYLLTAFHTAAGSIGCCFLLGSGIFTLSDLTRWNHIMLAFFSVLYTLNIAISNVSLKLVTIPFHQVVRATTPIFAIFFNYMLFDHSYSKWTYISLIPIILGVAIATYGDYYFTTTGFILTLLGAILAALKTVLTNRLQTGFSTHLSALEILHRMSPLACAQSLMYSYLSGELHHLSKTSTEYPSSSFKYSYAILLLFNAALAFLLNYVSFTANRETGALTMTVAANLKQILTIVLSIVFFRLKAGLANVFGVALTLIGGAVYAKVELEMKARKG